MSPFTVLTNADVCKVLDSLTREDVLNFHRALADALHAYSTGTNTNDSGCVASNQPSRIKTTGKHGLTTLFMPATSDDGIGVKIVTLAGAASEPTTPSRNDESLPTRALTNKSSATSTSSKRSSPPVSKSTSQASSPVLERTVPYFSPSHGNPSVAATSLKGSITLLTPSGEPRALLNATTFTAFRTALASMLLFKLRASVHTVTVFGAGAQAYWHIHLALLLRGPEIVHLHVVNRSFDRAQQLLMSIINTRNAAVADVFTSGKLRPSILTPEYGEYTRLLKDHVRAADVLICTTPSTEPLFPGAYLTHTGGRRKGRYIVAIGSYKPHMIELDPDILRQAVAGPAAARTHAHSGGLHVQQKLASEGGAVVVDSIEGAMKESGEVIQAGLDGSGMVELGELVMLRRSTLTEQEQREKGLQQKSEPPVDSEHDRSHGGVGHGSIGGLFKKSHSRSRSRQRTKSMERTHVDGVVSTTRPNDGGLMNWLERGNLIYKSVGLGLMDVVVGMGIVQLADARGIGTRIASF